MTAVQSAASFQGTLATIIFANGEPLFPIEAMQFLQVHDDALPIQHHMDAAITEAPALGRNLSHGFPDQHIIRAERRDIERSSDPLPESNTPRAGSHHALRRHGPPHPALRRAVPFFDATSFKTALSSIASAKSFFS